MKFFFLLLILMNMSFAQESRTSEELRADSFGTVMLGLEPISTWVPYKKKISYTQIFNQKWSLEGEYAWSTLDFPFAGVDLGAITEKRISLMARYYPWNSFHFLFGAFTSEIKAKVGNEILSNVTGERTTSSFEIAGVGVTGGVGNRWQWGNGLTLGIDWFRLNVPVALTHVDTQILDDVSDEEDTKDIKKVIRRVHRLPTFASFGIAIGYTF